MFRIICHRCRAIAHIPKCSCGTEMEVQELGKKDSANEFYYYFMHRIKVLKKLGNKNSLASLRGAITQSKKLSTIQKQDLFKTF